MDPTISKNYKLLLDPLLVKGANAKVYRYDGVVPDDPTYPPVFPCDPRKPLARLRRLEPMEMIVPRWDYHLFTGLLEMFINLLLSGSKSTNTTSGNRRRSR